MMQRVARKRRRDVRVASVVLAVLLIVGFGVKAQQLGTKPGTARPVSKAAQAEAGGAGAAQLPVTRVALYKNGVGFFEHAGRVTGDARVAIDFTTAQLNDVLQSLTAIDLNGGRIAGAGYNSTTPLEEQLKALPLGLDASPTTEEFYEAIRGARVEVKGTGATVVGRLLGVETVTTPGKEGQAASEKRLLTVVGDGGEVRTLELTPATEVRLLDGDLHTDVTRYLQLLASTRNQGLRHLTLQDNGAGARELRVSYISEVPVWKSTYRILFTEPGKGAGAGAGSGTAAAAKQTATLQGWSVVDNTTGVDWMNVQLSLIAGAPQSFIQPLSVPYYSRRPEIPLPQEAQLTPQTHESGDLKAMDAPPSAAQKVDGFTGGSLQAKAAPRGVLGGVLGGVGRSNQTVAVAAAPMVLDSANATLGGSIENETYQELATGSFGANATTGSFDDYFAYKIAEPVTIRKNESAMVPILQTKVDAERVTLWTAQQRVPLRALWLTNTSALTLDRGSFSIVEDGNFGGEGLLDPIHAGEKRLLSYAVDQAVRVGASNRSPSSRVTEFIVKDGWMRQISSDSRSVQYDIHNASSEARTVVIEHPITAGWTIDKTSSPAVETTATVTRYRAMVPASGKTDVHVDETRLHDQNWHLMETDDRQFDIILHNAAPSPRLLAAIQPVVDARRRAAEMQTALNKIHAQLNGLRADEERERANVSAVAAAGSASGKASQNRFVQELNATEDAIGAAQKELATAEVNLAAAKTDLAGKIDGLQLDEKL